MPTLPKPVGLSRRKQKPKRLNPLLPGRFQSEHSIDSLNNTSRSTHLNTTYTMQRKRECAERQRRNIAQEQAKERKIDSSFRARTTSPKAKEILKQSLATADVEPMPASVNVLYDNLRIKFGNVPTAWRFAFTSKPGTPT